MAKHGLHRELAVRVRVIHKILDITPLYTPQISCSLQPPVDNFFNTHSITLFACPAAVSTSTPYIFYVRSALQVRIRNGRAQADLRSKSIHSICKLLPAFPLKYWQHTSVSVCLCIISSIYAAAICHLSCYCTIYSNKTGKYPSWTVKSLFYFIL